MTITTNGDRLPPQRCVAASLLSSTVEDADDDDDAINNYHDDDGCSTRIRYEGNEDESYSNGRHIDKTPADDPKRSSFIIDRRRIGGL